MQTFHTTPSPATGPFQTGRVAIVALGHLIHDSFASFLAPLMPLIIEKLGISLTQAGSLASFLQFPSLINPFLGLALDRRSLRWPVILAPTITATAMSLMGMAPNYAVLAIFLLAAGVSSATWHVPAPVLITRAAGRWVGRGMSFFMVGGELACTVGPLLAVAAVHWWGLGGIYRLIPLGVAASAMLYWRTRDMDIGPPSSGNGSLSETWQELRRVLLPIAGFMVVRGFMAVCLSVYLPTLLAAEGATLWKAGGALSLLQLAGATGALVGGTISDHVGSRRVLTSVMVIAPVFMLLFLQVRGWAIFPMLIVLGFILFSTNPVLMALVQEHGRDHPATANGLYMAVGFVSRSLIIIAVGAAGDQWGLRTTFHWSAWLSFLSLPFVLLLPKQLDADT